MSTRNILFLLFALPGFARAQVPTSKLLNAPTLTVLLANRPAHIAEAEWLAMMEKPVNRALYPLRFTQAMLDTLDARQLDLRFQYLMVPVMPPPAVHNER